MNKTNIIIGLVVLAVVIAFSYGLYRHGAPQQSIKEISKSLEQEQAEKGAAPADEIQVRQLPAGQPQEQAASQPTLQRPEDRFVFQRLQIKTSAAQPEACLLFSKPLAEPGKVKYEDYVRFEGDVKPAFEIADNELCIKGLEFAKSYKLNLRKGLPSAGGDKLVFDESIPIELQDRPPLVQFRAGHILPRRDGTGVTVTTVNVDLLDISIYRVGDRLLSQLSEGLVDQTELYSYERNQIEDEQGQMVWKGQMVIKGQRNSATQTIFNIRQTVKDWQPGVYLVIAEDAADKDKVRQDYYSGKAAQWIINSDMGLTTFDGENGLTLFVRSLASAETLSGVKLDLVARNNEILASAKTDDAGKVHFSSDIMRGKGGMHPVAVMAYGPDKDFNYIDLRRPGFDLTDRGVGGRAAPSQIDAYLYTDRGIYRPGEEVHLVALLRDRLVNALSDVPLTISVRRPDGVEFRKVTLNEQKAGASATDIALTKTAPHGLWQAVAYVEDKTAPVGRVSFEVQDFVPQRLKVDLKSPVNYFQPGDFVTVDVESRFLYGAPASDLGAEAELKIMQDPNPYPDYADYHFGRVKDSFNDQVVELKIPNTDGAGKTAAVGNIPDLGKTTLPLRARIRVAVYEPGGRSTWNEIYRPVRTNNVVLGIRPGFDNGQVREGVPATFEVIALDKDGKRVGRQNLRYRLVREEVYYQWYQENGRWQYEAITRDRPMTDGKFSVGIDTPEKLTERLSWGQYRLIVSDDDGAASASVRFGVGWGGEAEGDRPDRVKVMSDRRSYKAGEHARVDVRPGVAGKALMVVASDRIFETREFDISEQGAVLDIPVSEDWGSGAYVMVTVYKPLSSEAKRAPVRSIGLTWLELDHSDRTLNVAFDVPKRVLPRQKITVPVSVTGLGAGETAYVTLAAVDEGILQLTRFQTPSPADYYFGKRRLGVDIRDDYGRLITDVTGEMGELRTGGDAIGGAGLAVVPTRTVALFSGLVRLDADGKAKIPLDIPDFAGELRLMAVVMSGDAVGMGEQALTVRDDVVAELTLPRFLAPGDEAQGTLLLHNVDGGAGRYQATITLDGPLTSKDGETTFTVETDLPTEQRQTFAVPLNGTAPGIADIGLALNGPGGYHIGRSWHIQVRPSQRPVTEETADLLPAGQSFEMTDAALADFYPETASMAATVSSSRGYDVPGLLRWLDRYPYGCLEQTVSRAMPLLYFNDLALLSNFNKDETIKSRVQDAVDRVLDMQMPSGGFGMWSAYDYSANAWLGVFAVDFLIRAQEQNYVVPNDAINRGLGWLKELAGRSYADRWVRSYAFYVLARAGAAEPGDVRYYFDTEMDKLANPLSAAQLGAALIEVGDVSRGTEAFTRALELADTPDADYKELAYGSKLRDISGVIAMASAAGQTRLLPALFTLEDQFETAPRLTTTQEKAWMLIAAHELARQRSDMNLGFQGTTHVENGDPAFLTPTLAELSGRVTVSNFGDKQVWRAVTVEGVPIKPLAQEQHGLTLTKSYRTRTGEPVNLADVKQNDQVVVVVTGQMDDNTYREMVASDLLPAGWEIDGIIHAGDASAMAWLPKLTSTRMAEARDDRFVAAFDIGSRYRMLDENKKPIKPKFALAYVARAVTPGTFVLPAAEVEDMYVPRIFGRTDTGELMIAQ